MAADKSPGGAAQVTREEMARVFLAELGRLTERWAVLHGRNELQDGGVISTDVDVASDVTLAEWMAKAGPSLSRLGLRPLVFNWYDLGPSEAVWVVSEQSGAILELDVLCDPDGLGRLGVPTDKALAVVDDNVWPPAITNSWSVAYLVSKRLWKRQWDRLAALRAAPSGFTDEPLVEVFGGKAGRTAARYLLEGASAEAWYRSRRSLRWGRWTRRFLRARFGLRLVDGRVRRAAHRVRRPVGRWIHLHGPHASEAAEAIYKDIAALLPRHYKAELNQRVPSVGAWRSVLSTVLRPGLAITFSSTRVLPFPDWCVRQVGVGSTFDMRDLRHEIIDALAGKVTQP